MKYHEKILPGFTVLYLHNSEECYNCQLALDSDSEDDIFSDKCEHKKKTTSRKSFGNKKPLKSLIHEAQKLFENSEFKFPITLKPHPVKPLKKKVKAVKKAGISNANSKALLLNRKKEDFKPLKNTSKHPKKNKAVDGRSGLNPVKRKPSNPDRINDSKVPGKGTLKRKRWYLSKLNDKNENYEDDLYEDQKFEHFQSLLEDETDNSEKYDELQTPSFPFSISPRRRTPSPTYRDCYSPTQLSIFRKGAEEYQYRRMKRKKLNVPETKAQVPKVIPQNRENDVQKRLEEVARILTEQQHRNNKLLSESDDDPYFSDLYDDAKKVVPEI